MHTKVSGIILYSKSIKENDLYLKILSKDDQLISGIVYGGNSTKKKNIYQIGYYLNLRLNKKNINYPFSLEGEISYPFIGSIINDKYKLYCLLSLISLVNLSIIEGQSVKGLFNCVDEFIQKLINNKKWINLYCAWLFNLLKVIGYELDYKSNLENKFFDIDLLEFTKIKNDNSIDFPFDFLLGKKKIEIEYMDSIFKIFERVFQDNHLINFNYNLPYNYLSFKKIILNYLIKKND